MSYKIWIEGCTKEDAHGIVSAMRSMPGVIVHDPVEFQLATPRYIKAARESEAADAYDLKIEDDAGTIQSDEGVWVQAWTWVSNEEMGLEYAEEDESL